MLPSLVGKLLYNLSPVFTFLTTPVRQVSPTGGRGVEGGSTDAHQGGTSTLTPDLVGLRTHVPPDRLRLAALAQFLHSNGNGHHSNPASARAIFGDPHANIAARNSISWHESEFGGAI
jgi:hypothetical protein